jgi:hypothetical protein
MAILDKSIKAASIANGALKLFQKAYDKLNKSDEILNQHNEEILDEMDELENAYNANKAQLNANAKVKAQLANFLPVLPPTFDAPLDSEEFEGVDGYEDEDI